MQSADGFEDATLNEMGGQGWEMVRISPLEETVPGGQWCRSVTVGYGFEVAWKRGNLFTVQFSFPPSQWGLWVCCISP